ncbi:MAG: class I SAM-dependent methyltransferase, partial [Alphaproteobacteria bacterium]
MSLRDILVARIRTEGPMSVAEFMRLCLGHPRYGYYMTRDPLGTAGDFTTAPEISQMFGELVGLALVQAWIDQGAPAPFCLAELGPGRGTLMADALRAAGRIAAFQRAGRLCLVETSPALRDRQAETLRGQDAQWFASVDELPDLPLFLIANEFFDALPIHQFHAASQGWCERMLGLEGDDLAWGLGPPVSLNDAPAAAEGAVLEHCPQGEAIAAAIGTRLAARGGCAIIVDYGEWDGT